MVVGHSRIIAELNRGLPQVSLFVGPKSVGKWTVAEKFRRDLDIEGSDLLRVRLLKMEDARNVVKFAATSPVGKVKLAIIRITHAQPGPLQVLLKALEESAPTTKFILIDTKMPNDTVVTRAQVFTFKLLKESQVESFLTDVKRFRPDEAKRLARLSGGQIYRALERATGQEARGAVLDLLRAFESRSLAALDKQAATWTDEHTELLALWCTEAVSGRWNYFKPTDVELEGRALPMKILTALRMDTRPRLVVRASLAHVLRGEIDA
jgi:replication-associated recombination protein RarA